MFFIASETDNVVGICDDDFTEEMVAHVAEVYPYFIYFDADVDARQPALSNLNLEVPC